MAIRHPGQFDLEFHAPALLDPEITASGVFEQEFEARASATAPLPSEIVIIRQAVPRSAVW